tara:strand:- start:599 stop:1243 length:645 start_codon:yes stop_codon:yes gene_type:complete
MELQSETRSKLTPAVIAARREIEGAEKTGKGNWGKYASAEDLIDCCMGPLLENDVLLTQGTFPMEGKNWVVTQVTHASGEFMRSLTEIVVEKQMDPKKALAGQTYARRAGIEALLAIPRLDDDGNNKKVTPDVPGEQAKKAPVFLTEEAREVFVGWVKDHGIDGAKAGQLLGDLGIDSSHKIPTNQLEEVKAFFQKEIERLAKKEKVEMEEATI